MKGSNYIVLGLLTLGLMACEMRDELKKLPSKEDIQEEGWFTLDVASNAKLESVGSKAVFEQNDVDPLQYPVEIINTLTGVTVHHYDSYADLLSNGQLKLTAGKYKVVAYNYDGSNVDASARPWFKGETEFEILAGKTTKVNTTCKLQNVAVTIGFTDKFKEQFRDDYTITVTNGDGGVKVFDKEHLGKTFYFKVPNQRNNVQLTVKATTTTNNQIAQNYTISKPADSEGNNNLISGDEFTVNIDSGDEPSVDPTTQIQLNITVDLTMHETGITVEIPTENIVFNGGGSTKPDPEEPDPDQPDEQGITVAGLPKEYSFSIAEAAVDETKYPVVQVNIKALNGIKKLLVGIKSTNIDFDESLDGMGLRSFDLTQTDALPEILYSIGLLDKENPILGQTDYLFDVSGFMSMLALFEGGGVYTFTITIGDGVSQEVNGDLVITVKE